ncbi:MAG: hypothetical protein ACT4NY_29230 [Pseudonocardiales bacterium]
MSYLDLPRVTFSGDFQADVSTVNNDVRHFDVGSFDDVFQEVQDSPPGAPPNNGWFNPTGSGAFRLLNCRVRGAVDEDGPVDDADPILATTIGGSSDRVSAKIVDLDPQWQLSSELWGLRVELVAGGERLLAGDFEPAGFRDVWFPFRPDRPQARAARYQSVLHNIEWAAPGVSRFADRLRAASTGGMLSIRLTTFAYDTARSSARFTIGSVVGAIGPYRLGEPHRFVAGRRFAPRLVVGQPRSDLNFFDGQVSRSGAQVTVDLANALPIRDFQGNLFDIGELRLGLLDDPAIDEGARVLDGDGFIALGDPLPYLRDGWLTDSAGIRTVTVPLQARAEIATRPLAVLRANDSDHTVLVRETPAGLLVRADDDLHRVEADESITVRVHVTRFGRPAASEQVVPRLLGPFTPQPPPNETGPGYPTAPMPPIGDPQSAITIVQPGPTDADGRTTVRIDCADPGHPRGYLDGQVYQLRLELRGVDPARLRVPPFERITALVFDAHPVPENPTWTEHIEPIFTQYGNVYPIMSRRLVDLGDYESVRRHRAILQFAFSLDLGDPNSMPVSRDLSSAKRRMVLDWLADPDLSLGAARPRPTPLREARAAPAIEDVLEPADSKERFARQYFPDTDVTEGPES